MNMQYLLSFALDGFAHAAESLVGEGVGKKDLQHVDETIKWVMLFSGLVAGGVYPTPVMYADVVTSTTHKVLRGPRGGIILTNKEDLIKKFNSAIFPGLQGGPLMHVIAAKAVCFKEALSEEFKDYSNDVINNAKILSD